MPTFSKSKTWAASESPIPSADLNSIGNDVASFLNTTKLDSDNIQDLGITSGKLAGSIAVSKLATTTPGYVLLGTTTTGVPTYTAFTGDVTVLGSGVTAIGANKVTNTMMADNAIDTAELAAGAVETAKIEDLNVTTGKLAADAVTGAKIADLAVDTEHLAASAVETAKINNDAVTADKISTTSTFRVKLTTDQSISASTNTTVAYDTVDFDPASGWNSTDKDWTVPSTGMYMVGATVLLSTSPTSFLFDLYKDGSPFIRLARWLNNAGTSTGQSPSQLIQLTAGEKIRISVFSSPGTAGLEGDTPSGTNSFWARRVE
jgi:hypothetical protein